MSNLLGSFDVITTDQSNLQMSPFLNILDSTLDIWSEGVLEAECTKECEVNMLVIEGLFEDLGGFTVSILPLFKVHDVISKSNNSKWLGGHRADFFSNLSSKVWVQLLNSSGSLDVLAHINDDLWCTLDVDNDLSWLGWVLDGTSRSLLNGVKWTGILDSSVFLLDKKVDWDISILQES
jgi:hypothetical protein